MRRVRNVLLCLVGLLGLGFVSVGHARSEIDDFADGEIPAQELKVSLRDRSGTDALAERLHSEPQQRERLFERLGAMNTEGALSALSRFLTQVTRMEDREWLAVVRALAPYAAEREGREWLFKILVGAVAQEHDQPSSGQRGGPTLRLSREWAAMGLAASGDDAAIGALGQALRRGGDPALMARSALLAHPPRNLAPLLALKGAMSREGVETLAALGDQRAFHPLRHWVRTGRPELQAAAALGLFRLGHLETVPLALHWLERTQDPELVAAATEILLGSGAVQGAPALKKLFELNSKAALRLAVSHPGRALAPVLIENFETQSEQGKAALIAALGGGGGQAGLDFLAQLLPKAPLRAEAALALARCPEPRAKLHLEQALAAKDEATQAVSLRALVVSEFLRGESSGGTTQHLLAFAASKSVRLREVAIWGLAARDPKYAERLLEKGDADQVAILASTAWVQAPGFFAIALRRLAQTTDSRLRQLLAFMLVDRDAASRVPTSSLVEWLDNNGVTRLAAATELAARNDSRQATRLKRLVESSDGALKMAAYAGLSENKNPVHTARLIAAYLAEPEPQVRRVLVTALVGRPHGEQRSRVLALARRLDPDTQVRLLASAFDHERRVEPDSRIIGREAAWLDISRSETSLEKSGAKVLAAVGLGFGRTLVSQVPADGLLVLLGYAADGAELQKEAPSESPKSD